MERRQVKHSDKQTERAKVVFRRRDGLLRTRDAIELGIHPRTLYAMRDAGLLERMSRGLYRLVSIGPLGNPDLVAVARKAHDAVICLISALAFHEVTTQVPHEVQLAVRRDSWSPAFDYPPVRVFCFRGRAFSEGIEPHTIDGVPIRIYCLEKTVADCFKFRNKIGLDIAIEALKECRTRRDFSIDKLMEFARICRVSKVIRPYLEALFLY